MTTTNANEKTIIKVTSTDTVCCPPKEQTLWNQHPRVYLDLGKSGEVDCPYCGNHFKLQAE